MRKIRPLAFALVLTVAFAIPALAGDMSTPVGGPEPVPGDVSVPVGSAFMAPGDMSTPVGAAILAVLQSLL